MKMQELRAEWKERVSTSDEDVLEDIWAELEEERYVDDALNEPEAGLEDLVSETETRLKWWRKGQGRDKPSGRDGQQEITPRVGPYEKERSVTLSEYLAKAAATDPGVADFRTEALGGEILTAEQARAFVLSPTRRFCTRQQLRAHGVPAKHSAMLIEENLRPQDDGTHCHYVQVRADPPNI